MTIVLKKYWIIVFLLIIVYLIVNQKTYAQCSTPSDGQNLIVNGSFSAGSSGFTSSYNQRCAGTGGGGGGGTAPGEYCVTNDVSLFHCCLPNFNGSITHTFNDLTPTSDNYAMYVDGASVAGTNVWCQTVTVQPTTNYFFTANVATMYYQGDPNQLGQIRFKINGVSVGAVITSPTTLGTWTTYTYIWSSGATSGPISICISNDNTLGDPGNDFVLDDITFTAGCAYGSPGPIPSINSGASTASICGNPSGILLNSGVAAVGSPEFIWKKDGVIIGGATSSMYNATAVGVYEVCARTTSPSASCWRSDNIQVINTYSVNLGSDISLCSPNSVTLNAGFTGSGVTYIWKKNGTIISGANASTYFVNTAGTYEVEVSDPLCGIRTDLVVISSTATTSPNNANFCTTPSSVNLSVSQISPYTGGIYNWYNSPVSSTILPGGSNTSTFTTPPISATTTYYVEDAKPVAFTGIGPNNKDDGYIAGNFYRNNGNYSTSTYIEFQSLQPNLIINEVDVYVFFGYSCTVGLPCSGTFKLAFYNTAGILQTESAPIPVTSTLNYDYLLTTVPVNVTLPAAGTYRVAIKDISSANNLELGTNNYLNTPCNYSAYNQSGIITFTNAYVTGRNGSCGAWPYYYNWKVSTSTTCDRIPVQAILNCPAPIKMLDFTVIKNGHNGILDWTIIEHNTNYFILERSIDGINFTTIDTVYSTKNYEVINQYQYIDYDLTSSTYYYRIKSVDIDESYDKSIIRTLTIIENDVIIFPIPSSGKINIAIADYHDESYSVEVINTIGQIIYSKELNEAELTVQINEAGCYFIKLLGTTINNTTKVIINK